jgi:Tfp pilus assembly protein PilX
LTGRTSAAKRQRGATLVVALIMLALITLLVINAFTLSSSNLKAVSNTQARGEALAAANAALESVVVSAFTNSPVAQDIDVDLDNDGVKEFTVHVDTPTCTKATQMPSTSLCEDALASLCTASGWYTDWDLKATATSTNTGAKVIVRQGVRVKLSDTQKTAVCASPVAES